MSAPSMQDIRLVEALVFASAEPVSEQAVAALLRSRAPAAAPDPHPGDVSATTSGGAPAAVSDDQVAVRATDAAPGDAPGIASDGEVEDGPGVSKASGTMADTKRDMTPGAASGGEPDDGFAGVVGGTAYARSVLLAVQARFAGSGVVLAEVANGWQFRTAPDLAPALTTVLERPRRLPRVAMETLAIIAYHQPCTRTDIEAIRGVSLGQSTLDQLLETGLITPRGRKEVPGRPILWGTSAVFLQRFGLATLRDLPRREELLLELPAAGMGAEAAGDEAVDSGG